MVSTVKDDPQAATAVTITLDSLANGSSRQGAAIDNSTNLYVDYLVGVTIVTPATGTLAGDQTVKVYVAGLVDGTHYTDNCTGSDAAFIPPGSVNSALGGLVGVGTAGQVLSSAISAPGLPFSVAGCFLGSLPTKFVIWATNNLGVALGTGNTVYVTPKYYQAV